MTLKSLEDMIRAAAVPEGLTPIIVMLSEIELGVLPAGSLIRTGEVNTGASRKDDLTADGPRSFFCDEPLRETRSSLAPDAPKCETISKRGGTCLRNTRPARTFTVPIVADS